LDVLSCVGLTRRFGLLGLSLLAARLVQNDLDLRDEVRELVQLLAILVPARRLEDRIQSVRLLPDRVNRRDTRAVRERIDVVADVGIGGREDDAATALIGLDGEELLAQTQSDRGVGGEPRIEKLG